MDMGKTKQSPPSVEQILRDARHHLEVGFVRGSELRVENGGLEEYSIGEMKPADIKGLLKNKKTVKVCAIGGIFLARALHNGSDERVRRLPGVEPALRLLALVIDPDNTEAVIREAKSLPSYDHATHKYVYDGTAYEKNGRFAAVDSIVTRFNDHNEHETVLAKFDQAIELAAQLKV